MDILGLLGKDLSGKLRNEIKYYTNKLNVFDSNRVFCCITPWNDQKYYTVSANCFCEDANKAGPSNILWFYNCRKKFDYLIDAQAYLEKQIRNASRNHPKTKFYRRKQQINDLSQYEYCLSGKWFDAEDSIFGKWCTACKKFVDEKLSACPNCAQPLS
jgi:hypothetical protein